MVTFLETCWGEILYFYGAIVTLGWLLNILSGKNCVSCNFCAIWNVSRADCVVGQPLARQGSRGRRSNSQNSLSILLCKSLHNKGSFTKYKFYIIPLKPPFPYSFPLFGRGHLQNHYYILSSKSPA